MFHNDDRSEEELARIGCDFARQQRGAASVWRGKPWRKAQWAWQGFRHTYPHRNLFVAGLPKSGTTWLERCLTSVPGYRRWIPGYIPQTGQDLIAGTLTGGLPVGYTVTRVHTQPKARNVAIVHDTGRPYVVMVRDLRDVVVSYYFYARNRSEVLLHSEAASQDVATFIDTFSEAMLPEYAAWCAGWLDAMESGHGMLVRYESMLADTSGELQRILRHFEIELSEDQVRTIAQARQFSRETGRPAGSEDRGSFNRKGVAGDWVGHFTESNRAKFDAVAGAVMARLGYGPGDGSGSDPSELTSSAP